MKVKLSEIRAQLPMYEGMPDSAVLSGIHKKFYSDMKFGDFLNNIEFDTGPKATDSMTDGEKFLAGAGKAMVDTGRGIGQMLGVVSRDDVQKARELDADLMNTSEGRWGNFAGNVATTLPLAWVPGANTFKGASLIGAATGLMQPSTSTSETVKNTLFGGAGGAGGVALGRTAAAGWQGATGLLRPMTQNGQRQIAAEVLQASATNPQSAAAKLASAKPLLQGSIPTVGQVADDAGLAQLERTLLNNPESAGTIQRAYDAQRAARVKAIGDVAGTPEYRKLIEEGRNVFAKEDYAKAFAQGIDADMAKAMQPAIDSLLRRPSVRSAQSVAKSLAAENDIALNNFTSLEGLDWLKKALDNQISKAASPGSSIGKEELKSLVQTKSDLMNILETIAPGYKAANDNFAKMSSQINAADVAADLQKRLYKNAEWGSGREMGSTYMNELSKAKESVRAATGMDMPLDKVMNPKDLAQLEAVARDLARKEAAQNLGRATGSNTMQNMLGQNLLQRVAGPLGVPQSFAQNTVLNTLTRPYSFVMQYSQPKISALMSEAMADPALARQLLLQAQKPVALSGTAKNVARYLPAPSGGLLASYGHE